MVPDRFTVIWRRVLTMGMVVVLLQVAAVEVATADRLIQGPWERLTSVGILILVAYFLAKWLEKKDERLHEMFQLVMKSNVDQTRAQENHTAAIEKLTGVIEEKLHLKGPG